MANYTRRAQNDISNIPSVSVSQFLREGNLNDASVMKDDYSMDPDLTIFENTDFHDFDTGVMNSFKPDSPPASKLGEPAPATTMAPEFNDMDFINADFNFDSFNHPFTSPINTSFPDSLQTLQPSPHSVYPPLSHAHAFGQHASGQPKTGEKRRATDAPPAHVHNRAMSIEEASRVAAEEDKRRRNTAASARFRVKKKQREAALEKSAKELNDKMSALESKISQLETENSWLKKLLLEKNNDDKADKPKPANATKDEITVKEVDAKNEKSS